jgi:hypothetical protein
METRRLEKSDIKRLLEIHKKFYNFPFPDINNPLYAIQRIVTEKDKIVLAAIIKLTSEGVFITDKDISPITRMKAIMTADKDLKLLWNFGLEDVHTFAENDDHYVNILRKLGFQDCSGHSMVKLK